MSKRSKILDLLTQNELTTKEIQGETGYDMDLIWQYINQFKNEGKIEKIGNKGRFNLYAAIEIKPQINGNNDLIDKLVLLMIKAGINSENHDIAIQENEIIPSINRLKESGLIG